MGPKAPKGGSAKARSGGDEKDEALQAVILSDTFETRFAPFTTDKPRCLLPLLNTPLIEYTLEYLASAGVEEIFFCEGAHMDQVEAYIGASKWKASTSPFQRFQFLRSAATSVGDAMRDLDQKHLITGDFLVVTGDIVSNLPIEDALRAHKLRRQKDKNAIMTVVLREATPLQRLASDSIIPTFVIDPTKDRCLHYEEAVPGRTTHANIDIEMLKNPEIDIRQDLIDCRIDICTPDVLSLWSDNFDNQSPRKDFLYGVLKDHELNGKTIHTYITKDYYAARVANLPSYDRISRDIIARSTFPICLDNNIFADQGYTRTRNGVYQEAGVVLARSCRVGRGSVIGKGTSIGPGSVISNSILGRGCSVGKNATISGAYIWDNAIIGSDVKILKAIVANDVSVEDRCVISEGALLSFGVNVAAGTTVRSHAKITRAVSSEGKPVRSQEISKASEGWTNEFMDDDEEETDIKSPGLIYSRADLAGSTSSLSSTESDLSDAPSSFVGSRSESFATSMSDDEGGGGGSGSGTTSDRFHHDAVSSIFDRMQTGTALEDVRVELLSLRLANNATDHQVRKAVAVAMMKHIQHETTSGHAPSAAAATRATLTKYRDLVQRTPSQDTAVDRVDFLLEAQRDLVHRADGDKILLFLAKDLYDLDLFAEDVFALWWADDRSVRDPGLVAVRAATAQFIDWLETAESESESEEEGEEESDDE